MTPTSAIRTIPIPAIPTKMDVAELGSGVRVSAVTATGYANPVPVTLKFSDFPLW